MAMEASALQAAAAPWAGMTPILARQVQAMLDASHGKLRLVSGHRTLEQQTALHDEAVARYGQQYADQWVANPADSNHVHGAAADIGGDLDTLSRLAPQFGLAAPMAWEPWHVEMASTRTHARPTAYTAAPPGEQNPTEADLSQSAPHVAASLAESLLGLQLQQQSVVPSGKDALQTVLDTAPPVTPPAAESGSSHQGSSGRASGGNYTPGGGAFGGVQQQQWAVDFLGKIGMPVTSENLRAVTAWEQAESGGGGGHFNPLNTTQGGYANESNYNSVGVKNYTSYEDGLAANAKVINNGRYGPILDALKSGNNAMAVAEAISQTPWGTGGLVAKILGGG